MENDGEKDLRESLYNDEGMLERIRARAYELYLSRGGEPGREVEDWLQAEKEALTSLAEEQPSSEAAKKAQSAASLGPTTE